MGVYKRGKVYWYEFEFAGSRIRESSKSNSKRIAEEAERKRRRDLELGINRIGKPRAIPLLKIAAQRVLDDKRRRRARNTSELYKYALKPVVEAFGSKLVCDISPEDIRGYQTNRLGTGVSARTVNVEIGALRVVLKAHRLWAPIADAVEMLRERKDVGRALSYGDEKKLIEAAEKSRSPALLPLLVLTLDTGLRAAEIRSLQGKDLSLTWKEEIIESGFITVPKSKTEAGIGRTIPLSRRACAALTLWLSRFSQNDPEMFIFPRHSVGFTGYKRKAQIRDVHFDQPIGQWKKAWKGVCLAAKVHYRWHDLRHTFITRLAERPQISEQTIMSLAGHVSRSMLARYSHIRNHAKQSAIEAVEKAASAVISAEGSPQKSPQLDGDEKTIAN